MTRLSRWLQQHSAGEREREQLVQFVQVVALPREVLR
jgi:hypothetical protein